ncbi:Steroid nuclear receptor ligand-binding [Zea mays]|uniref:Steroid nuclear receptor ligand-binding n=1 Tax=Zea mays TaxID=4577 RepID=A0A1D6LXJ8_MAIZE|nr:Steroid nuclear receptor ligand-binding [Zea mays]
MQVPVGFLGKLWSFVSFVPFFVLLLLLGSIKAALVGPVTASIVFFGSSAVIIGLWPAHFIWTYYCVLKTERIGLQLKILTGLLLPLPLLLLPVLASIGSLLGGTGYGVCVPLMATFEAVGEGVTDKLTHCFTDGTVSAMAGACTVVRDVTDFCFHSYFSFMDDLIDKMGDNEEAPLDIKLSYLPRSMVVALIAVPVDVLLISAVALWKSPCMLFKGWQRLCEDLVGREGPFLETVCVPFAGLAIVLWPLAVIGGLLASFFSSFFFGFRAGLVAYQEASFQMGLAYMISAVAIFDEYTNDLLYLREGSCLPRPKYRRADIMRECETEPAERQQTGHHKHRRTLPRSKTFMQTVQRLRPIQIWDWFFRSCELNGRILLSEGLITAQDMEQYITNGKCKKLDTKLPCWSPPLSLFHLSVFTHMLPVADHVQVTTLNWPKDRVLDWLLGPLLLIKDQMKKLEVTEDEEMCLRKLIMTSKNEKPSDWDDSGFPSDDNIKRGQLQSIIRRLQGIVAYMSRVPSFRRRFINLVKAMYLEAIEAGAIDGSRKVKADVADRCAEDIAGSCSSTDTPANIHMV